MTCPICNSKENPLYFPTVSQGPVTRKYSCGSEYYNDYQIHPCGYPRIIVITDDLGKRKIMLDKDCQWPAKKKTPDQMSEKLKQLLLENTNLS